MILQSAKQANLSQRNFKTGTATDECNTPLERSLLGIYNELSFDSIECSIFLLSDAKHSTLLF